MNEQERTEWNAAVTAAGQDPTPENIAARDRLRDRFLTNVHEHIMTEDRYQERTRD